MNMKVIFYVALISEVNCLSSVETDLILAYLKENYAYYCFFLVCWTDMEKVKMITVMMEKKLNTRIAFLSVREGSLSETATDSYSKISYVLDMSCTEAPAILKEGSETFKFMLKHSWLILEHPTRQIEDTENIFGGLELRIDMDVKIAVPITGSKQYDIYEIYHPGLEVDYRVAKIAVFKDGHFDYFVEQKSFFEARKNMSGVLVRNANVVNYEINLVNFTAEFLWKNRNVVNYNENGGLFGLYLFRLFEVFVELLGFHYNTSVSYPWFGYSANGTEAGLGKLLYEKKADIQTGGGIITVGRTPYFESLAVPYIKVKTFFLYRSPGIKKPGAQVLAPLEPQVWYWTLVTLAAMTVSLKIIYWAEFKFLNTRKVNEIFLSAMTVIETLTQQGSDIFPQGIGGKIMFLNALIFSIWVYNYYTSGLVSSLLNSKPKMLTTYQDLYESPLQIGMEDQAYTHLFVMNSKDRYLRQLYDKKIYGKHGSHGPNIYSAREGMEKVRQGGFAFHTMVYTAYPIISTTFEQEAICDLGEIGMLDFVGAMFLLKKSQYKELFITGFTKLWEDGLSKLIYDRVIISKPECRSNLLLAAVGPQELFLVYIFFAIGVVLSIVILITEIIYHKFQIRSQRRPN